MQHVTTYLLKRCIVGCCEMLDASIRTVWASAVSLHRRLYSNCNAKHTSNHINTSDFIWFHLLLCRGKTKEQASWEPAFVVSNINPMRVLSALLARLFQTWRQSPFLNDDSRLTSSFGCRVVDPLLTQHLTFENVGLNSGRIDLFEQNASKFNVFSSVLQGMF